MIKISKSNVFNVNADAIVNTINCVGFMGKGLALEYALRYPDLLDDYQKKCEKKEIKIGKIYYYKHDYYKHDGITIVNFPTKYDYKFPSKIEWIKSGLINFKNTYKNYKINTIAFPLLGCSNGGLNRKYICDLMINYLKDLDINVIICLNEQNPEGKELEMINNFKRCSIDLLNEHVKLNSHQKEILLMNQTKIQRFNDISKLEGIGKTTYRKIFSIFYKNEIDKNSNHNSDITSSQLSLF